jgi:hypothetical protein
MEHPAMCATKKLVVVVIVLCGTHSTQGGNKEEARWHTKKLVVVLLVMAIEW